MSPYHGAFPLAEFYRTFRTSTHSCFFLGTIPPSCRFMHLRPVYGRLHKFHHFYKSPEPFDDLMIHPLEAFGYYVQLYSPPFLIAMPLSSFLMYMAVCGVCGVLDHSGVKLSVPGLYDTAGNDWGWCARERNAAEMHFSILWPLCPAFCSSRGAVLPHHLRSLQAHPCPQTSHASVVRWLFTFRFRVRRCNVGGGGHWSWAVCLLRLAAEKS